MKRKKAKRKAEFLDILFYGFHIAMGIPVVWGADRSLAGVWRANNLSGNSSDLIVMIVPILAAFVWILFCTWSFSRWKAARNKSK